MRGGSDISAYLPTGAGSRTTFSSGTSTRANSYPVGVSGTFLDSPNTTSSITYSMKVAEHGSSTFYFNNSSGSGGTGTSSMTLMEILA